MSNIWRYGGLVASIVLIAFGIGAIYTGFDGRARVSDDLAREKIVGTPDSSIPGQLVDSGKEAEAFAAVIRKHTLEATMGQTYSQMPRFLDANGKGVEEEAQAAKDPKSGRPVENPARDIWISSTAFRTALQTAYFAEGVATFAIVMGFALLLTGIGFLVLSIRLLGARATEAVGRGASSPATAAA
jgi:hypothetical protein